jgi:hypothetical protein
MKKHRFSYSLFIVVGLLTSPLCSPLLTAGGGPLPLSLSTRGTSRIQAAQSSIALFRPAGATIGEALLPRSSQVAATQGQQAQGRTTPLDPASFTTVTTVKVGDHVFIPITELEGVTAIVKLVKQEGRTVRIGGQLAEEGLGTFFLSVGEGRVSGSTLLQAQGLAYRIDQTASGEVVLREVLLSDVTCPNLPRMKNEPEATSSTPLAAPPLLNSRSTAVAQLYLDFDGESVSDPSWAGGATINAQPYNLSAAEITAIFNRVKEDYWPFNINVTTDVQKYNNAPVGKRMHCIITPNDTASPGAGGVAYVNSFA